SRCVLAVARALWEMMDRIAQGPEDVKKSVRPANEIHELSHLQRLYLRMHWGHPLASRWED
ncbi:MAG: hypothetical protein WBD46_20845, partial [Acidobacteriaceae bacterium]